MSTYLSEVIEKQQGRIEELNTLDKVIQQYIENNEVKNAECFNALCRATIVLVSAHTEGFIEDTIEGIIYDINSKGNFEKASFEMQYNMCLSLLPEKDIGKKITEKQLKELIRVFKENNVKFEKAAFVSSTKNPNPSVVDRICTLVGFNNFFIILDKSAFIDKVFENSSSQTQYIFSDLLSEARGNTLDFPYKPTTLLQYNTFSKTSNGFWKSFLDDLVEKRNRIAHGSDINNSIGYLELKNIVHKSLIFQLCFFLCLSTFIGNLYK